MERVASASSPASAAQPIGSASELPSEWSGRLERLVPLWRHAVWLVALFALLTLWVDIRVDVQQVRKDLDRSGRAQREAQIQNDRLRLERDARLRSVALESAARQLAVGDLAQIVRIETPAGK